MIYLSRKLTTSKGMGKGGKVNKDATDCIKSKAKKKEEKEADVKKSRRQCKDRNRQTVNNK